MQYNENLLEVIPYLLLRTDPLTPVQRILPESDLLSN